MHPKDTFSDISRSISDLKKEWSEQVNRLGNRLDELVEELESRFGNDDKHIVFRALPAPRPMTMPLTDVFNARASTRAFSDEPLSDADLGTLLWAANGINRKNGRRTTPSALDWREIDVYVLKANGIWRWIPEKQGLIFCEMRDIRSETIVAQPMLHIAPVHFVFVTNQARTETFLSRLGATVVEKVKHKTWSSEKLEEMRSRSMIIDAGVCVQAVYMAAAALDIGCVARTGFDKTLLEKLLRLKEGESVAALVTLGYRPHSLLDAIR